MCGTIPMVDIDKTYNYDFNWGVIIMSRIIAMTYNIDKNHYLYSDLRWGVMIMPRIIVMISTEEMKSPLWFILTHRAV